jgi:hypothetical protein
MAKLETDETLQNIMKASLEEAKKKSREKDKSREEEEEEEEEDGEEEEEEDSKESDREQGWSKTNKASEKRDEKDDKEENKGKKRPVKEETLAASSLHPAAKSISDSKSLNKSKIGMMTSMMHTMNAMTKSDLIDFFNKTMSTFGPGKDYGIGDKSGSNASTIDMKASYAVSSKGPKTKDPMPKLNVKEDMEEIFSGQELSEEFKENVSVLFETAVNARLVAEVARLEEQYEEQFNETVAVFTEEISTKLDTYLDYVVENWMEANEVAIETSLRNELAEEFIQGLRNLFSEHYINVPQEKIDVIEAMAEKIQTLEQKLDETISENSSLKESVLENEKNRIFESLSDELTLTQKEKFENLVEGIEFDGDLETFEKKLKIVRENYFNVSSPSSSNIHEETFEGEEVKDTVINDPSINRYVQAISRTVKSH